MPEQTGGAAVEQGSTPTNPRGIPCAPFVDKVEDYVSSRQEVEATLRNFQEMISKYQFMELNLQRRIAGLKDKMPDIQKTLDTVRFLKTRTTDSDPIETTFELNDTLYTKATIPPTDEVYLWLGANVMLSYPLTEAETLLTSKLAAAKQSHSNCEEDLEFCENKSRRWRLRSLVCITGTWCRNERRKPRMTARGRGPRTATTSPTDEGWAAREQCGQEDLDEVPQTEIKGEIGHTLSQELRPLRGDSREAYTHPVVSCG